MAGYDKALAIFEMPPTDNGIIGREWIEYRPVSTIKDDSAIEFNIPPLPVYLDLKETRLLVKAKIEKNGWNSYDG
jgi:hypothetical protein